jgi:Protein of unknown function (DUF2958)
MLSVERDLHLVANKTISAYADEARAHGHIVTERRFGRLATEAPNLNAILQETMPIPSEFS